MKTKAVLVLSIFLFSCFNKKQDQASNTFTDDNKIINIDINKEYPQKNIVIQDIAKIEYIPLETNNNSLLKNFNIGAITDSLIIPFNREGDVFIFNREGKFLNTFNRFGGSGEEYSNIYNLSFDNNTKEIYIENMKNRCEIYVYTLNGKFKRKFSLPEKIWPEFMLNYDDNYLLCYDCYNLDIPESNIETNTEPYFLVSKKNGEITPIKYEIQNRISNSIKITQGKQSSIMKLNIKPLIKNGEVVYISDFSCDTIYSLKGNSLTPVMVKNPSIQKNDPPKLFSINLLTDKYILMSSINKRYENNDPEATFFGYDIAEQKFYDLNFLNADWKSNNDIKIDNVEDLPQNIAIRELFPEKLMDLYEKGLLRGKLKEVASKLSLEDNPVLMLVNFNK